MAVQIPDPGTGNGQTGDNEYVFRKKVKDNFSDQINAASRMVGVNSGNLPEFTVNGISNSGIAGVRLKDIGAGKSTLLDIINNTEKSGFYYLGAPSVLEKPMANYSTAIALVAPNDVSMLAVDTVAKGIAIITLQKSSQKVTTAKVYTDKNTTLDGGYLVPSSPVLRLSHANFVKEHEAEQLDIKVDNPETGVYKITGTTGLRSDGGWYFRPPKDEHINVLCMVDIEEEGDTITVKTYAKKFDFNTVSIVPDYDNPVDIIGEVLLRFNDLPEEDMQGEVANEPIE